MEETASLEISRLSQVDRYQGVRSFTEYLCETLETEDFVVQSMTDVSPTKWHLAHTTWFFETFVLKEFAENYTPFNPHYAYLFNSYYVQAGERYARERRGQLTRPTVAEIFEYRAHVDRHMIALLETGPDLFDRGPACVLEIGLNHEQQHQELLLTDIKHLFSVNPLRPALRDLPEPQAAEGTLLTWTPISEGVYEIGYESDGFHYDNEGPRHRRLQPLKHLRISFCPPLEPASLMAGAVFLEACLGLDGSCGGIKDHHPVIN